MSKNIKDIFTEPVIMNAIISMGAACRPAHYLRKHNLRYFSSPFDWMMHYSLISILNFFDNGINNFFKNYEVLSMGNICYNVLDKNSNMISMHSFKKDMSIENQYKDFIDVMKMRFDRLLRVLHKGENICFISNRPNSEVNDIYRFIEGFEERFNKSCLYVNIVDCNEENIEKKIVSKSKFINIFFNDEHPNGRNSNTNQDFWMGNIEKWDQICSVFLLNKLDNIVGNIDQWKEDRYFR